MCRDHRRRQPPQVQPHGENSAVGAFPLHFRAVNLAELAARRHQPRIVFREAKQIAREVQIFHAYFRSAAEHAAQRRIGIEKGAVTGNARDPVNGVFDEAAISRFGNTQRFMCALILVAQRFFAERAIQRDRQSLQAVFENVVVDALLDAIDGRFFAQRSGDQQEWNVAPAARRSANASRPHQPGKR